MGSFLRRDLLLRGMLFVLTVILAALPASADIIETYAGNGTGVASGDGGPAVQAGINLPWDVAVDPVGAVYVSNYYDGLIRKVGRDGIITTVAGTGVAGYSGDGGPAVQAMIKPKGIALDAQGNLYIAEYENHRVRRVDANGIITTVAGTGGLGFSGDGGPATGASMYYPVDVALDNTGNLYISDLNNARVRKVDANGIITTIAGNGSFWGPSGDGGAATDGSIGPTYMAFDRSGNLYVADSYNYRIRKIDTHGIITTVAGNGTMGVPVEGTRATEAAFLLPSGVAIDKEGNLLFTDMQDYLPDNRVWSVDSNGILVAVAGNGTTSYSGDGGLASEAGLAGPMAVAVDGNGDLYIADSYNNRVRWVNRMPYAEFTAFPVTRGYRNANFGFSNTTRTASGTTYLWNFGDGTTSGLFSPSHAYPRAGVYSVSLTATGGSGYPEDVTSRTRPDYILAGYVFSSNPATATTAPFTRSYALGGTLYARIWALQQDVDYTNLRNNGATVTITDYRGRRVTRALVHEGNGIFSTSVPVDPARLAAGNGTASFSILDRAGRVYTAAEGITLY